MVSPTKLIQFQPGGTSAGRVAAPTPLPADSPSIVAPVVNKARAVARAPRLSAPSARRLVALDIAYGARTDSHEGPWSPTSATWLTISKSCSAIWPGGAPSRPRL